GAELFRRFDRGERLVPEHDFFAGFLPQALREIAEALFAASDADDERLRANLVAERGELRDDVTFIAQNGVRRGDLARVARGDSDSFRAEVDADHHRARSIAAEWHSGIEGLCRYEPMPLCHYHLIHAMKNFNLD